MAAKPDIKKGDMVQFDDSIFDRRLPPQTWISGEVMRIFQNRGSLRWRVEIKAGDRSSSEVDIESAKVQKVNPVV